MNHASNVMANREIPLIDLTLFTSDTPWITIGLTGIYTTIFIVFFNNTRQLSNVYSAPFKIDTTKKISNLSDFTPKNMSRFTPQKVFF